MNIIATAILLIFTLLVVPAAAWLSGASLGPLEWQALHTLLWMLAASWAACFIVGELTGNVSQVDKLWSLLPIAYCWVVAAYGDFGPRLLLMALLVTAWGARLTWNFSRRGGYRLRFWDGEEDYRWQVLRERPEFRKRPVWTLFNLLFISGYQNILILLFTLPSIVALQYRHVPLNGLDLFAAVLMATLIAIEALADNQQWLYQSEKQAQVESGQSPEGNYAKGFLDQGLWSLCRHPNYAAEQGLWIAFYGFSVAASGLWLNWSVTGCLLLVILFRGSVAFSEEISASKYPEYAEYQQRVPRFIPKPRLGG